jgi:hypothetical protein
MRFDAALVQIDLRDTKACIEHILQPVLMRRWADAHVVAGKRFAQAIGLTLERQ